MIATSGFLTARVHQIHLRPLGELTALPQTPQLDLRGPTSKGGEGREGKGGGRERGGK